MDGYIIARYAQTLDALLLMGEREKMTVLTETRAVSDSSCWSPTCEKPEEYIAGTFVYAADFQMPEDRIVRLPDSFQSGGLKLAVHKLFPGNRDAPGCIGIGSALCNGLLLNTLRHTQTYEMNN